MTNKSESIVPVFRAKTRMTNVDILGSLDCSFQNGTDIPIIRVHDFELPYCSKYVNDETIEMSLDGTKFYSMEEVRRSLEFTAKIDKGLTDGTIDIIGIVE
jgi:hypothetical protein